MCYKYIVTVETYIYHKLVKQSIFHQILVLACQQHCLTNFSSPLSMKGLLKESWWKVLTALREENYTVSPNKISFWF